MNIISDVIPDQGGETIGSASGYVSRFKKIDAGEEVKNVPEFTSLRERIVTLPSDYTAETEKEVLTHYYRRLGDHTCTDFKEVSGKVASNINRLFSKTFSPEEIQKKLETLISLEDVVAYGEKVKLPTTNRPLSPSSSPSITKIKISLKETSYSFIKDRPALSPELLDLLPFVESSDICFSSDGYSFFISTCPGSEKCFDNLFNFSTKEEMVYQMFKEQLGDDIKAKKLVLMSRLLNETTSIAPEPKKEVIVKKSRAKIVKSVKKAAPSIILEK